MALLSFFRRREGESGSEMSFVDHLEALRGHIIRALLGIMVAAIVIFIKIDWVFDHIIMGPVRNDFVSYSFFCNLSHKLGIKDALCMPPMPPNYKLLGNTVSSPFVSAIQIGLVGGFIFAFPYVFWEFWKFIKPALSRKELRYSRNAILWVSLFFFIGGAFGYFILGPFTFNFLANFNLGTAGFYKYMPTLDDYIDNLVDIILGCGLAFELPILSHVLTKIGLITPRFLSNYRKYAYVVILVVAAVITPSPDWTSQMIVFIPLAGLYELSIMISKRAYRRMEEEDNWQ